MDKCDVDGPGRRNFGCVVRDGERDRLLCLDDSYGVSRQWRFSLLRLNARSEGSK
jgi:hypothetical protein